LTSGGGRCIRDLLNTTVTTANLKMNGMDKTLLTTSSMPQKEGGGDDISSRFVDFCKLCHMCQNCVQLHYSSGSYHGSPSPWAVYALAQQQFFRDVPDLLWLACVGVMDRYLHGRLNLAGYLALSVDLQWLVGRLFPNDAVNKAGRAVFAKDLESNV
jgi:hypothetical protein